MKDRMEYIQKVDELIDTVLEIRTDIMMNSLIEKAHDWQIKDFDESVVSKFKERTCDFLEDRQSKLSGVTKELTDMCYEIANEEFRRRETEREEEGMQEGEAPRNCVRGA